MTTWGNTQQVCATCRYWMGRREIEFTGTFYKAIDAEGKCANPYGGFRQATTNAGASCSDWESFKEAK